MTAPYWPMMLKRSTAAAYLDLSEAAFEREVAAGRLPMPVQLGKRDHWNRVAIDEAVARLNGPADAPDWRQRARARYGKAA